MDQINNRHLMVSQYFGIRIALNRANGLKNLDTELEFELRTSDSDESYIIIKSNQAKHGLRICHKNQSGHWQPNYMPEYCELSNYLTAGAASIKNNVNSELTIWLRRLWVY